MQRGFAQPLLIILVLVGVALGAYLYVAKSGSINNFPAINKIVKPINDIQTFSNLKFNFEFKYAKDLLVKEDSEEDFNKRGAGDFRKNFRGYVAYEPGKFLSGVVVLDKSNNFDTNPFTLWVFDNPQNLSINSWFDKYWYYPFLWGVFDYVSKGHVALDKEATVSGQMAKYKVVSYQPGSPKYIYISKEKKMYLFRIIGEEGDKILSTFKFTN